jgi:hypothetical protein
LFRQKSNQKTSSLNQSAHATLALLLRAWLFGWLRDFLLINAPETHLEPNRWQQCQSDWKRSIEGALFFSLLFFSKKKSDEKN